MAIELIQLADPENPWTSEEDDPVLIAMERACGFKPISMGCSKCVAAIDDETEIVDIVMEIKMKLTMDQLMDICTNPRSFMEELDPD